MEKYFNLSKGFIEAKNRPYRRYLAQDGKNPFKTSLTVLLGQRGVGKTTLMIQHMLDCYKSSLTEKALYVPVDHFLVASTPLYEIAEGFHQLGGELLCLDEIHKRNDWSRELKSINDSFPKLKVVASGSSALEIGKGSHDLSRRAIVERLAGLSFREFVELELDVKIPPLTFDGLLQRHRESASEISSLVEKKHGKILALFKKHLKCGHYPYYCEFSGDVRLYHQTLEQGVHATIESDLVSAYPALTGASVAKIKRLLAIISKSVPFKPDMRKLKTMLEIGDERTLKTYVRHLDEACVIMALNKEGKSLNVLEKPEKIYLGDTNLIYAFGEAESNVGNIRETFFLSMVRPLFDVRYADKGDFVVNGAVFEVGGKGKDFSQVKDAKKSYLAVDDTEIGFGNKIPLWLFGFLY